MDIKKSLVTLALVILILFPSPLIIYKNYQRLQNPPIQPQSIENTSDIPDNPQKIEDWVEKNTEYQYDFKVHGSVWYIPTPEQTLKKGKGDCKARAILLASIFEKKGIDYELHISMFHWWVSYENNNSTWAEDNSTSLKKGDEWTYPDIVETLEKMWSVKEEYYKIIWGSMPNLRQLFLLTSLAYIWIPTRFYHEGLENMIEYRKNLKIYLFKFRSLLKKKIRSLINR